MSKKGFNSKPTILIFLIFFSISLFAACPEPAAHFCNVCVDGTIVSRTGIINNLTISGTAPSFACNQGALTVAGGVGIQGNLNVCGTITATGGFSITGPFVLIDNTQSTDCTNGAITVPNGGVGIGGNLNVCGTGTFSGPVIITNNGSVSGCTGGNPGLTVQNDQTIFGDLGVGGDVNICGQTTIGGARSKSFDDASRSVPCTGPTLRLEVRGDVGITDNLYVCNDIFGDVSNATETATNTTEARTIADKFSEMCSVKDFGAQGDGITDDTVAFQDALDNCTYIHIPTGIYMVSNVVIPNTGHRYLYGDGRDTTIIKQILNTPQMLFQTPLTSFSTNHVVFADMTLDGQASLTPPRAQHTHLVSAYILSDWRFIRCTFQDSFAYGVGLQGMPTGGVNKTGPQTDILFQSCMFIQCGLGPTLVNSMLSANISSSDTTIPLISTVGFDAGGGEVKIDNEIMRYGGVSGNTLINVVRGVYGSTAAAHLAGATARDLADDDGVDIKSSDRLTFFDCYALNCADKGFNPRSNFCRFVGCSAVGCGSGFGVTINPPLATAPISSFLNGAVTATDTTITLVNASAFLTSGYGRMGIEEFTWSGKSGNQLTGVVRGVQGTIPIAHNSGTTVLYDERLSIPLSSSVDGYIELFGCSAENCITSGFTVYGGASNANLSVCIDSCKAINNGTIGFYVAGTTNSDTAVPMASRMWATVLGGQYNYNTLEGIRIDGASDFTINGATANNNGAAGIRIFDCANGGIIEGCTARNNATQGILIHGQSTNVRLGANYALNNPGNNIYDNTNNIAAGNYYPVFMIPDNKTNTARFFSATASWTPGSITNGSFASTTVNLAAAGSAVLGNPVFVGFSRAIPAGATLTGDITSTGVCTVTIINNSGATINLAAGTIRVVVFQSFAF